MQVNGERQSWDAIWVKAEELIREGILISPSMANDHYAVSLQVGRSFSYSSFEQPCTPDSVKLVAPYAATSKNDPQILTQLELCTYQITVFRWEVEQSGYAR